MYRSLHHAGDDVILEELVIQVCLLPHLNEFSRVGLRI
jgi:hypothetical protein